jgi:hypothetical protein
MSWHEIWLDWSSFKDAWINCSACFYMHAIVLLIRTPSFRLLNEYLSETCTLPWRLSTPWVAHE